MTLWFFPYCAALCQSHKHAALSSSVFSGSNWYCWQCHWQCFVGFSQLFANLFSVCERFSLCCFWVAATQGRTLWFWLSEGSVSLGALAYNFEAENSVDKYWMFCACLPVCSGWNWALDLVENAISQPLCTSFIYSLSLISASNKPITRRLWTVKICAVHKNANSLLLSWSPY